MQVYAATTQIRTSSARLTMDDDDVGWTDGAAGGSLHCEADAAAATSSVTLTTVWSDQENRGGGDVQRPSNMSFPSL